MCSFESQGFVPFTLIDARRPCAERTEQGGTISRKAESNDSSRIGKQSKENLIGYHRALSVGFQLYT